MNKNDIQMFGFSEYTGISKLSIVILMISIKNSFIDISYLTSRSSIQIFYIGKR